MADPKVTDMTKQFKYTGKGYLDNKMQPVDTVAELKSKFVKKNELKLGLVVTVLNPDGDNKPVDYWYYHPYDEATGTYDTSAAPDWYPKPYLGSGGTGDIFWQDGAASGTAGYEAWKDAGIE